MRADLHSHSIYSDGYSTLYELVKHAKKRNIDVLALTDHDTLEGDNEFIELQKEFNMILIKGIELTCKHKGKTVHIVGLFKNNYIPEELYLFCNNANQKRKERAIIMMNKINEYYGLDLDIDLFLKKNRTITRKNMLNFIMEAKNMTYDEAKKYTEHDSKAYIPSEKLSEEDGIKILHDNNALAIFAHPCLMKDWNLASEIAGLDFDGIEAKYANVANDYDYFKKLADKHNLFISAGSDYHGDTSHGDLGTVYLEDKEVKLILDKLNIKYDN